eukprot:TCONS_00048548-protein
MAKILFMTLAFLMLIVDYTQANACCSYPCKNRGVCVTTKDGGYSCDCTGLDYYGNNCETPYFGKRIRLMMKPSSDTVHYLLTHFGWFWSLINRFQSVRGYIMGAVVLKRAGFIDIPTTYNSEYEYVTAEAYFNQSQFARTLPPVPKECPTPMGVAGKKELPDIDMLIERFFTRKEFKPEPSGTNVLFAFFAQFFTHQFFKTDFKRGPNYQWGNHGVDCSNIYGADKSEELKLRSMKGGKLKTQVIDGEIWPPNVKDADVEMIYQPDTPEDNRFALGHRFFGILPGLVIWSTVFVREHNKICDMLAEHHPDWSDEQLFQTTRNAIIGITIKIVVEDYVQHISGYHFKLVYDPEVAFGKNLQYQNRISMEFNHAYHWHPLVPSVLTVEDSEYTVKDILFKPGMVLKHGFKNMLEGMTTLPAGRVGPRNHDVSTLHVVKQIIEHGRQLRLQSFNNYRERFGETAYNSFEELVGSDNKELAKELSDVYGGDINAVEFFVGMMMEKHRSSVMFGESMTSIAAPSSVFGLFANPISSPQFWKPSTFGGEEVFKRVKTMNIKTLFCENLKDGEECPHVDFRVPDNVHETYKDLKVEL